MWEFVSKSMCKFLSSKITSGKLNFSYQEFIKEIELNANKIEYNLLPKSKVIILTENQIYTAMGILIAWRANMIPIPLARDYGEDYCSKIMDLIKPDLVIVDNANIIENFPTINSVYDVVRKDMIKKGVIKKPPYNMPDGIALIMCTSGTTGKPKGVMIKTEGLITNVIDISKYFCVLETDRVLIARPLFHCAVLTGEFLLSLFCGADIHFLNEKYNPQKVLKIMGTDKITVMGGTPNLFFHISRFMTKNKTNVEMRLLAISGECMTSEVAKCIRSAFPDTDIFHVYGLTEASPRVSYLPAQYFDEYPESVGVPLEHVSYKIVNDKGEMVNNGIEGQLYVKGISIMAGYYAQDEKTREVLSEGWLKTKDIALINKKGFLVIKGRQDDMIIKAGMNVYPSEIEDLIKKSWLFDEVVVFGVKSRMGDKIIIYVVPSKEVTLTKKELVNTILELIPSYQYPDDIKFVDKIPKTASQKIVRKELAEKYMKERL